MDVLISPYQTPSTDPAMHRWLSYGWGWRGSIPNRDALPTLASALFRRDCFVGGVLHYNVDAALRPDPAASDLAGRPRIAVMDPAGPPPRVTRRW